MLARCQLHLGAQTQIPVRAERSHLTMLHAGTSLLVAATVTVAKPLDGPRHSQREVVQAEHLAQVLPAGGADGPQRVAAALKFCHRHILMTVRLQELQSTLGQRVQRLNSETSIKIDRAKFLPTAKTYRFVAVRVAEFSELGFSEIFELVLLSAHGEDWLRKSYTQS